jgi:hypothetical protein
MQSMKLSVTVRRNLESKQDYVRWINQQGGVPDIMDEKTLIEFVLLGDPSIHPVSGAPAVALRKAAVASRRVVAARPSILEVQERRLRRIVRAGMAVQIRGMLPVRAPASRTAVARASKIFAVAKTLLENRDPKVFGFRPKAARVEMVETRFPSAAGARAAGRALAARAAIHRRSLEYYWSGRRIKNGHKQIRMVKVEADVKGHVIRSVVVHSS